jgi:hypothetical protein
MIEFKNRGVYAIINEITGEMYIGSSSNIGGRKDKHFSLLRHNKHTNSKLQESVNLYGIDCFKLFILEYTDDLINREQYFVDYYNPYFNITTDIINNTPSESSRKKMSETRLRLYSDGLKPNCAKEVIGVNIYTGEVISYETIRQASTLLNINRTSIQRVLRKIYYQTNGYKWYYKQDYDLIKLDELLETPEEDNQQPS